MKDFMKALGELQPATLVLLIFAAVLLLLLLVLIIVTIRVLRSKDDEDESEDEEESTEDKTDETSEVEDETTKKINEAVQSVEETRAKVEAEKIAKEAEAARKAKEDEERESAKAKVEEIAKSVKGDKENKADKEAAADQDESDDDDYSEDDTEITNELDSKKIEEELSKSDKGDVQPIEEVGDAARDKVQSDDYDADMDSAFIDKPDVPAGKTLDATEEAIVAGAVKSARNGGKAAAETAAVAAAAAKETSEPKPKKNHKKKKAAPKSEIVKPSVGDTKSYWYNKQDVEGLARKEDMYFKCHYFTDPDDALLDLITEMYDCGYVRTEQLQRIAYGITFKSLGMKEILQSDANLGFNKDTATKEPTEADKEEVYIKWCEYVDNFFEIAVIEGPEEVKDYIKKKMYEYGRKDVEDLMYSPY